ncbi:hypothetical protein ASD78_01200 [Lysobacter sp. Root667]|uniref:FkbM family methyltransferase n=1 Tax=Lysobacter sp. Root667 TaxID=1736581 RepID=UPI0006F64DAE|nr:FkbM family methyltransferase [Lysobacter sp. Root667]KRA81919.1 hypothetical protein ASD78_01200 [Lysobacter sp. Root667]
MTPGFDADTRRTAHRVRFDDGPGLWLRPDSWDYGIVRSVVHDNEYRLPQRFDADDLILDIGAHIGAFAHACLQRGAGRVVAFEPERDNFALATANLQAYGERCVLRAAAVWRSDIAVPRLGLRRARLRRNTGGHDVLAAPGKGATVAAVALDEVLAGLARPVRLLKIDCEGAEYPILMTARRLDRVEAIVGEFHAFGVDSEHGLPPVHIDGWAGLGCDAWGLAEYLRGQGFEVDLVRWAAQADHGLFFAHRR